MEARNHLQSGRYHIPQFQEPEGPVKDIIRTFKTAKGSVFGALTLQPVRVTSI